MKDLICTHKNKNEVFINKIALRRKFIKEYCSTFLRSLYNKSLFLSKNPEKKFKNFHVNFI